MGSSYYLSSVKEENNISQMVVSVLKHVVEFFAFNTKLQIMEMLASDDFFAVEKFTSSGAQLGDHWIRSLVLILLS